MSASTIVRGTVAVAAITVGTTYAISVAHHDAPAIPMISDTFVKAPESYVSRLGIVTVATLLQFTVWFLHSYLCAFAAPTRAWRCFTLAHSLAGALGSVALGMVGAVNDRENMRAHLDAATTFFLAILAWKLGYTAQLVAHPNATTPPSVRLKCACAVATFTALVAFFTLANIDLMGYYTQIATCEWIVASGSLVSIWSLSAEFSGDGAPGDGGGSGSAAGARAGARARGLELGSLWRGPTPGGAGRNNKGAAGADDDDEMLDVVLAGTPEEDGSYHPLAGASE